MRKKSPSSANRTAMIVNYGHIHDYKVYLGEAIVRKQKVKVYKCSQDATITYQQV